jgi:diguanylate cyclase (GGDEF)-like protein
MLSFKKAIAIFLTLIVFIGFDVYFLAPNEGIRTFNLIAEFYFALIAAVLFLSVDALKGRRYYNYLNIGFYLAFVSMYIDWLDQLHYHNEVYTAIGEKLTLMISLTLIIIGIRQWIVDFSQLNKVLQKKAMTDELTGLYNRRGLLEKIEIMEQVAMTSNLSLSFVIADLDDFKEYNDAMGHMVGDELLCQLGKSLLLLMNKNEVIGRWGGEEFAICLLGYDVNTAKEFAEKVRLAVQQIALPSVMGNRKLSLSLGVAEHLKHESIMDTIKRADRSLYKAKRNGKNQVFSCSTENTQCTTV